jgi:hypothetical protein
MAFAGNLRNRIRFIFGGNNGQSAVSFCLFVRFEGPIKVMMRLQLETIADKVYKIIDEELEMETDEAKETYKQVVRALFKIYARKYEHLQTESTD